MKALHSFAATIALTALLYSGVHAEEAAGEGHAPGVGVDAGPLAGGDPLLVMMPTLVAPIAVKGRVHNYVYLNVQVFGETAADAEKLRLRIPYIQDAFIREVHRESITVDGNPEQIDGTALLTRLEARAREAADGAAVKSVTFTDFADQPPPEPAPEPAPKAVPEGGH
jgi:hypothetical protein